MASDLTAIWIRQRVQDGGFALTRSRVICVVAALVATAPLVLCVPAPLQDWPNHLSRVHILAQMLRGPSMWDRFYDVNTFFLPNVILDGGLLGLLHLGLGLNAASVVFLLLTYALFVTGFCALCRGYRAFDDTKILLGALLFFSLPLFFGFVNFQFGVAAALWATALWLQAGERVASKLAVALVGAAAIFFCHIVAAVIFVLVLGCTDLVRLARAPTPAGLARNTTSLAAGIVVVALLLRSPTSHDHLMKIAYVNAGSVVGFAKWKASLFVKAMLGGGPLEDAVLVSGLAAVAVALLAAARLRLSMIGFAAVAGTILACIAAPTAAGRGALLDDRLALLPLILLAAALRFDWRGPRGRNVTLALLAALVVVRSGTIVRAWRHDDAVLRDFAAEGAKLPRGSTVMTALGRLPGNIPWNEWWTPPIIQLAAHAAMGGLFVPTVFADPSQQPLELKPGFRAWEDPLDFSDAAAIPGAMRSLRDLCAAAANHPVYLLLLYPTALTRRTVPADLILWRRHRMRLIDGCAMAARA